MVMDVLWMSMASRGPTGLPGASVIATENVQKHERKRRQEEEKRGRIQTCSQLLSNSLMTHESSNQTTSDSTETGFHLHFYFFYNTQQTSASNTDKLTCPYRKFSI